MSFALGTGLVLVDTDQLLSKMRKFAFLQARSSYLTHYERRKHVRLDTTTSYGQMLRHHPNNEVYAGQMPCSCRY